MGVLGILMVVGAWGALLVMVGWRKIRDVVEDAFAFHDRRQHVAQVERARRACLEWEEREWAHAQAYARDLGAFAADMLRIERLPEIEPNAWRKND